MHPILNRCSFDPDANRQTNYFFHMTLLTVEGIFSIIHRYIDDIFLTYNASLGTLNEMLDKANNLHSNITLIRQIGRSLPFLDVLVENK